MKGHYRAALGTRPAQRLPKLHPSQPHEEQYAVLADRTSEMSKVNDWKWARRLSAASSKSSNQSFDTGLKRSSKSWEQITALHRLSQHATAPSAASLRHAVTGNNRH